MSDLSVSRPSGRYRTERPGDRPVVVTLTSLPTDLWSARPRRRDIDLR